MTEIRKYINLIESAQNEVALDEASPFRHALTGALAAGMAFGAPKAAGPNEEPPAIVSPAKSTPMPDHPHTVYEPKGNAPLVSPRPIEKPSGDAPTTSPRPQARPSGLVEPSSDKMDADTKNPLNAPSGQQAASGDDPAAHMTGPDFKKDFVRDLLPRIESENAAIVAARKRVEQIRAKGLLSAADQAYLDKYMDYYKVKERDLDTLLSRMNVIPPSIILAQAALESGWGRSRLAKSANALFGQKGTGDKVISGGGANYAAFDSRTDSVRSYMRNLNTHGAYRSLRDARNSMVTDGEKPDGVELARHLKSYSTRGEDYVREVINMIRKNGFDALDDRGI